MVIVKIRKMSIKGVKLKSESFFPISPGVLELWRKTLGGGRNPPPPPVQIGLKSVVSRICLLKIIIRRSISLMAKFEVYNVFSF